MVTEHSCMVTASKLWNAIPIYVRNAETLSNFLVSRSQLDDMWLVGYKLILYTSSWYNCYIYIYIYRGGVAHRETGKFPGGPQGSLAWWAPFAPRILAGAWALKM